MPIDEPPRAGFTNHGDASSPIRATQASASVRHSASVTITYGPVGSPCTANCCFIAPLSWQTALDRTPAPTYRTPIISNRPWIVPSSPNGPCSSANATSMGVRPTRESPSTRATSAPDAVRMSTASGRDASTVGREASTIAYDVTISSSTVTQRPPLAIPTQVTSKRSRSRALRTPPAVRHEISCSDESPPKTSSTRLRTFWPFLVSSPSTTLTVLDRHVALELRVPPSCRHRLLAHDGDLGGDRVDDASGGLLDDLLRQRLRA